MSRESEPEKKKCPGLYSISKFEPWGVDTVYLFAYSYDDAFRILIEEQPWRKKEMEKDKLGISLLVDNVCEAQPSIIDTCGYSE